MTRILSCSSVERAPKRSTLTSSIPSRHCRPSQFVWPHSTINWLSNELFVFILFLLWTAHSAFVTLNATSSIEVLRKWAFRTSSSNPSGRGWLLSTRCAGANEPNRLSIHRSYRRSSSTRRFWTERGCQLRRMIRGRGACWPTTIVCACIWRVPGCADWVGAE
jgi:hypothetical protein